MPSLVLTAALQLTRRALRKASFGRLRPRRFRGSFASHADALRAVRTGRLGGYDHPEVVDVAYGEMCEIKSWDYPIMFWLEGLLSEGTVVLDAGGHMGTKYRAFRRHLRLDQRAAWTVYDVPAMVRAGRARALTERLHSLRFIDDLAQAPAADILLASGLLQYLDIPFTDLLHRLPALPRHLLLNKVALRAGESRFVLENFGHAEVPYQIRNQREFVEALDALGYAIVDEWIIPSLSAAITAEAQHGAATSRGYYAQLR